MNNQRKSIYSRLETIFWTSVFLLAGLLITYVVLHTGITDFRPDANAAQPLEMKNESGDVGATREVVSLDRSAVNGVNLTALLNVLQSGGDDAATQRAV